MSWLDDRIRAIHVTQQKTGAKLAIPVHTQLRRVLDAASREHKTILSTEFGKPFTVAGYSQWLRAAITAAAGPSIASLTACARPQGRGSPRRDVRRARSSGGG